MTKEQEQAIEMIKEQKAQVEHGIIVMETNPEDYDEYVYNDFVEWNKNAETVLNLIQTQQEEIEKKDKIINEMACTIYDYANLGKLGICDCELEDGKIDLDLCNQTLADRNCNNCIKQYFERKIENDI